MRHASQCRNRIFGIEILPDSLASRELSQSTSGLLRVVQLSKPIAGNISCLAAMAFWAVGFPAGEILLDSWGTVTLIVIRLFLAVTCLFIFWIYMDGFSAITNAPWTKAIVVGGIGFGLGTVLLLYGQKLSDPVTPAIAAAMMPIAGAVLEVMFDGRRLRPNLILGIILAIAGGLMATGAQLSEGSFGLGAGICLLSVALFAWGTRATTTDLHTLSPIGQSTATMMGALCLNLLVLLIFLTAGLGGVEVGTLEGNNIYHLLSFAIFSLAISQFLWIWGAGKLGILLASFHMNAMPFYVMVFVVLLFDGSWNWSQAAGAGLVAAGVIIAQTLRPRRPTQNSKLVYTALPTASMPQNQNVPNFMATMTALPVPAHPVKQNTANTTKTHNTEAQPCPPFMWMGS